MGVNSHGTEPRGGRVVIDRRLSAKGMQVVVNTDPTAPKTMQAGAWLGIDTWNEWNYVSLDQWLLGPSEGLVLANRSAVDARKG